MTITEINNTDVEIYKLCQIVLLLPEHSVTPTRMDKIQAVAPLPSWK